MSGAPRYPLMTAADAIHVIDRVKDENGANNVRLLADLYHLHVNGDDVAAVIATTPTGSATCRSPSTGAR